MIVVWKAPAATRIVIFGAFIGTVLPILIFFNLYHEHDYYLCAVLPLFALVAGYGLDYVVRNWVLTDWRSAVPIAAGAAISLFIAYDYVSPSFTISYDNSICVLGKAIDEVSEPNDCVVVADWFGSQSILYYAKRRGCAPQYDETQDGKLGPRSLPFLREEQFTTLVCQRDHPWFDIWPGVNANPARAGRSPSSGSDTTDRWAAMLYHCCTYNPCCGTTSPVERSVLRTRIELK